MKVSSLFLVISGLFAVAVSDNVLLTISPTKGNVSADIEDFMALLPAEKIGKIIRRYIVNDTEVQGMVKELNPDDVKEFITDLMGVPEMGDFLSYTTHTGVDIRSIFRIVRLILGFAKNVSSEETSADKSAETKKGIDGMIEEVRGVLPLDELRALNEEKLKSSKAFANMNHVLFSEDFLNFYYAIVDQEVYRKIVEKYSVDLSIFFRLFITFFNMQPQS